MPPATSRPAVNTMAPKYGRALEARFSMVVFRSVAGSPFRCGALAPRVLGPMWCTRSASARPALAERVHHTSQSILLELHLVAVLQAAGAADHELGLVQGGQRRLLLAALVLVVQPLEAADLHHGPIRVGRGVVGVADAQDRPIDVGRAGSKR